MSALRAEWTKLRSVRSTFWSLLVCAGATILVAALVAETSTTDCPLGATECGDNDLVANSLTGVYLGQLAVVSLAVLAITSEYATRTIRATFTAVPRRRAVLAAKAAVVAVVVFAVGLGASAVSLVLGRALFQGNGFDPAHGYAAVPLLGGPTVRAVVGSALYLVALALLALGVGAVVRHTAAAVTLVVSLLFVPLVAGGVLPERLGEAVQKASPVAGLAVQRTIERPDVLMDPWAGLAVAWGWAAAALLAGLVLLSVRDA